MEQLKDLKVLSKEIIQQIQSVSNNSREASQKLRVLIDELVQHLQSDKPVSLIQAPNVVIEVIDEVTGQLYRRYLEIEYQENDNGIQLYGEDLSGSTSRLVFLSNQALEKIHDLQGLGRDEPRCDP